MENKKNIIAYVQARSESVRFPNKIFKKINGEQVIEIILKKLKKSKYISKIVIVSYKSHSNKHLIEIAQKHDCQIYFGDKDNVLKRFYNCSKKYKDYENILRITGDCPLIDVDIVDNVIFKFLNDKVDYCSNINPPTFPDGLDVEIFKKKILHQTFSKATNKYDKEHVTPYILRSKNILRSNYQINQDLSEYKLSLDDKTDLKNIILLTSYYKNNYVKFFQFKNSLQKKFKIFKKKRNSGYKMNLGQKIWTKANEVISGGNMFFSKNPDNFLPSLWPAYFSKAKGSYIWDLENKKYIDCSLMGIGTNILGYANPIVDRKVKSSINQSNMSTLNCKEEVILAEKLLEICKWGDKVKLARTGGELNSIAIRIARAATGRDKVAVCGYHGWHDWYLAANLKNKNNLDNHLFSGLDPLGVPKNLSKSVFTFQYNNISQLEKIINKYKLAAIKMEVIRNTYPDKNFLKKVRSICNKNNIILIFDECTTGFRETYGGIYKNFGVEPDMVLFGKALGNGYPITALVGKQSIMDYANKTFISSTFWSDRIGPTAAIATLNLMQKEKSWLKITNIGKKIKKNWKKIAEENKIKICIQGIDALPNFYFNHNYNQITKFFLTQEMLKKRILANFSIYCAISHTDKILSRYFDNINDIFYKIKKNNSKEQLIKLMDQEILEKLKITI